jgi:hypothetical protein
MANAVLTVAKFLGRSRKIAVFAGMVAAAGAVNEVRRRREERSAA